MDGVLVLLEGVVTIAQVSRNATVNGAAAFSNRVTFGLDVVVVGIGVSVFHILNIARFDGFVKGADRTVQFG